MRIGDVYYSELAAVYQQAHKVLQDESARLDTTIVWVPRSTRTDHLRTVELHMMAWAADKVVWSYSAPLYRPPRRQLYPAGRVLVHGLYRLVSDLS